MAAHYCTTWPCPLHSGWSGPINVISRPCGHSYAVHCGCSQPVGLVTTANLEFHDDYVGRHRKDA